ncbi:MAG: DUF2442 domain-containing protein [Desulfobacterales bacterium]|nr:DUF2442 domain-containing protein [Desulfobacterales bacterium]
MMKYHNIKNLKFEGDLLVITIDENEKTFYLNEVSPVLKGASEKERSIFEISPSGYGNHWPLLDEDLSIDGLLGIVHSPLQKRKTA